MAAAPRLSAIDTVRRFLTNAFIKSNSKAAPKKPTKGDTNSAIKTSFAFAQLTPSPKTRPAKSELAKPTPMMEPTKVCELEAGNPRYQVPKFQMMAEMSSENTIAKPAPEPTFNTNSTGKRDTTEYATKPVDVKTPSRLNKPDQTTA